MLTFSKNIYNVLRIAYSFNIPYDMKLLITKLCSYFSTDKIVDQICKVFGQQILLKIFSNYKALIMTNIFICQTLNYHKRFQ